MPTGNSNVCRFCGAREAITVSAWPNWASCLVAKEMALQSASARVKAATHRILTNLPKWHLRDDFIATRKIHIACCRCHYGWMRRIDALARPMALPLIKGDAAILGHEMQRVLSAWIAKTVMIAELASTEGAVSTRKDRNALRLAVKPPDSWQIWAAHNGVGNCEACYVRHTARLAGNPACNRAANDTQSVTFGMGRILVHVMSSTVPGMKFELPATAGSAFQQLWPAGNAIAWPPKASLSEYDLAAFSTAFDRDFGTPEVEQIRAAR